MKRFLLLLTLFIASAGMTFAQSVTINKIWLEKDITLNGKLGMKVHFYLRTDGLKNVPLSAIAYFDEPKGVGVQDTDGRWCTTSGTVAIWSDFTPPYETATWDDYWFFTAYEDLHIKDYNKTYYCHVFVFDKQGKQYGNTDYVAFQVQRPTTAISKQSYSHLVPAPDTMPNDVNRYICYKNKSGGLASIRTSLYNNDWKATVYARAGSEGRGSVYGFTRQYTGDKEWVFRGGVAKAYSTDSNIIMYVAFDWSYIKVNGVVFDIPISKQEYDAIIPKVNVSFGNGGGYNNNSGSSYNNNDSGRSYIDGPCKYCGGGGGCRSCNGRGYKYNPYSGHDDTCPSCNGSGRCFNCRGTGKQATY